MGAAKNVSTLTTICTPHNGLRLIDNLRKSPEKYSIEMVEKAFDVLGMSVKNVNEFTADNIKAFN